MASLEEVAAEASVLAASTLAVVVEIQVEARDVALEREVQQDAHPSADQPPPVARGSSETKFLGAARESR